jgi:hypothetical protein
MTDVPAEAAKFDPTDLGPIAGRWVPDGPVEVLGRTDVAAVVRTPDGTYVVSLDPADRVRLARVA